MPDEHPLGLGAVATPSGGAVVAKGSNKRRAGWVFGVVVSDIIIIIAYNIDLSGQHRLVSEKYRPNTVYAWTVRLERRWYLLENKTSAPIRWNCQN